MVLAALPGRADDTHERDWPVGNRAMGLGGAFAALSDDPSGLYYNPAGIVGATRSSLSASTTLFGLEQDGGGGTSSFKVIAGEVGGLYAMGLDAGRPASFAWAFEIIVPSARSLSGQTEVAASDARVVRRREGTDETLWAGLGAAWRLSDTWSVGASAFYVHRVLRLGERTTYRADATGRVVDEQAALEASDGALFGQVGLRWSNGPWSAGLMLRTPSLSVRSTGNARATRAVTDGVASSFDERSADTELDPTSLRAETKLGASGRLGVAYAAARRFTMSCDLIATAGVDYERLEFADPQLQASMQLVTRVHRLPVVDVACGGEWLFHPKLSIALGAFTNRSSAPEPSREDSTGPQLPHVDLYGGTVTVGYFGDYSLTRIGVAVSGGSGTGSVWDPSSRGWQPEGVTRLLAHLFVASTFRY